MRQGGDRLRCVIVGDGPLRAALQAAHPDVVFCGVRTDETLAAHYASADVFLFPSETETFGNVVLEALASGLVVVAYDYAAARAHVRHAETGWLAPYADRAAFVGYAVALARMWQSLEPLRRRARQSVLPFAWASVVNRFELLLTDPSGGTLS
jgi:glycosyltransferase involved in cell wall biosynthesis